jgi:hypothetical protein
MHHEVRNEHAGKCRRFPPIIYYDGTGKKPTELWPTVNENWWCGEFRARRAKRRRGVREHPREGDRG